MTVRPRKLDLAPIFKPISQLRTFFFKKKNLLPRIYFLNYFPAGSCTYTAEGKQGNVGSYMFYASWWSRAPFVTRLRVKAIHQASVASRPMQTKLCKQQTTIIAQLSQR